MRPVSIEGCVIAKFMLIPQNAANFKGNKS